ncbi:glutathione S-transferase S1 [Megachile rotundata]|uniref:glutathione S-transferase S1 n=1 Tax=Megachile rotundata TaxID=143995 RepID=UPI000258E8B4|nr:PREDICTED: glutathione S-transferase-like [Megachile rotundata]
MPSYKLTYFNVSGLGEPIRFILHQSGIPFEDKRLTFEEWPQVKAQMPLGQVPVLEIDGKPLYQSKAISRYLAKKNNLYGSNDLEAYEIDATIDTLDDLRTAFSQYYWEKDAAVKSRLKETLDTKKPFILQKLDEQVKKNGGYFVGGKLTWPDLTFASQVEMLNSINESDVTAGYPSLQKLVQTVKSLPKIKAYLDKRPKTQF